MTRAPAGDFRDKEVALLQTFADQAVIAIENVRLFNETKEALELQTATAEVLRVIGESMADAQPVFDSICASLQRLLPGTDLAISARGSDGRMHWRAGSGEHAEALRSCSRGRRRPRTADHRRPSYWPDLAARPRRAGQPARGGAHPGPQRSMLSAAMTLGGRGVRHAWRRCHFDMRPFSENESRLVKAFADQAVIAIQNARLFNETQEALERQTATADMLRVISSSPTDVQPVFDAIVTHGRAAAGLRSSLRDAPRRQQLHGAGRGHAGRG